MLVPHLLAAVIAAATPPVQSVALAPIVEEASKRSGLPTALIWAVIRVESAENPRAVSAKGAMGLMQLMPGTWAAMRTRLDLGDDPFDPHDNVLAGAAYLRTLYDTYGTDGYLAAYNAGPGRYESHRAMGRALPLETQGYVVKISQQLGVEGPRVQTPVAQSTKPLWMSSVLFIGEPAQTSDQPPTFAATASPFVPVNVSAPASDP